MRLREKFTFANPAMATLQVEPKAHFLTLGIMVPDLRGHCGDVLQLPEIERLAPDEGLDRVQEICAERAVACADPRPDERRLLPRQRARFIIADRRFDGQSDGADLRRWPQPHVDAKDISVAIQCGQKFDDAAPIAHGGLCHIVAFAVGQGLGIEQENRVNVRRIIQFAPAMFAQRNDGKALIGRAGHAFFDSGGYGLVERMVCKVGKNACDAAEIPNACEVRNRGDQRNGLTLLAQGGADIVRRSGKGLRQRRVKFARCDHRHQFGIAVHQSGKKRTVGFCACDDLFHHNLSFVIPAKAGIHGHIVWPSRTCWGNRRPRPWIPAFARMTMAARHAHRRK